MATGSLAGAEGAGNQGRPWAEAGSGRATIDDRRGSRRRGSGRRRRRRERAGGGGGREDDVGADAGSSLGGRCGGCTEITAGRDDGCKSEKRAVQEQVQRAAGPRAAAGEGRAGQRQDGEEGRWCSVRCAMRGGCGRAVVFSKARGEGGAEGDPGEWKRKGSEGCGGKTITFTATHYPLPTTHSPFRPKPQGGARAGCAGMGWARPLSSRQPGRQADGQTASRGQRAAASQPARSASNHAARPGCGRAACRACRACGEPGRVARSAAVPPSRLQRWARRPGQPARPGSRPCGFYVSDWALALVAGRGGEGKGRGPRGRAKGKGRGQGPSCPGRSFAGGQAAPSACRPSRVLACGRWTAARWLLY